MLRELFIIGTSGLAKECAQLARQVDPGCHRWQAVTYVTDVEASLGTQLPYGGVAMLDQHLQAIDKEVDVVIGIGYPHIRKKIFQRLADNPHIKYPNLIHPAVEIDPNFVKIGQGNIVAKGVVITCDVQIGNFNLFNWNSTLGHDTIIGNFNVINPSSSISGRVIMGDSCLVGTGARILEQLVIASHTSIGAGAVVTRSIEQAGIYIGLPARIKE